MTMPDRLEVLKTYKTYVGGKFPRSESERTYRVADPKGNAIANACRCTRKDVRDAVVAARSAFRGWSGRSAYNRGQILYRIAEMLEGRKDQFIKELALTGKKKREANSEIEHSIDRLIYYAGWTDKYTQVFGAINPVASSYFNFSIPEPTGVVGIIAPDASPLLSVVTLIAPAIAGGNCTLVLASEINPLPAVSFVEVLHASDVPGGVINILTGLRDELIPPLTSHMDVNAVINSIRDEKTRKLIDENGSISIKRIVQTVNEPWTDPKHETPYILMELQEIKTTWHPVGL